ncbi:hypothetical protein E2C01_030373 [Portunus trituberculatus]|uniref:Uncharacterized protein n=1 Tax=Portunus trituberculatus TaxID=210409 RepID=A0A5B7EX53_PORTR|nr:hypothetical protein [Portunus trituberculatus]
MIPGDNTLMTQVALLKLPNKPAVSARLPTPASQAASVQGCGCGKVLSLSITWGKPRNVN